MRDRMSGQLESQNGREKFGVLDLKSEDRLIKIKQSLATYARKHYLADKTGGEVDDLVQETLARAWAKQGEIHNQEDIVPWLFTVMKNAARDMRRKKYNQPHSELEEALVHEKSAFKSDSRRLDEIYYRTSVEEMLRREHPENKKLWALRIDDSMEFSEIAEELNINVETAKSRFNRMRRKLKVILEKGIPKIKRQKRDEPDLKHEKKVTKEVEPENAMSAELQNLQQEVPEEENTPDSEQIDPSLLEQAIASLQKPAERRILQAAVLEQKPITEIYSLFPMLSQQEVTGLLNRAKQSLTNALEE